jgi:hypothetical protein
MPAASERGDHAILDLSGVDRFENIAPSAGLSAMFLPWRLDPWQPVQSRISANRLPCATLAASVGAAPS